MEIEIFTLCEAATDSQGKLNLLGAFNIILAKEVPATHPFCAVALRLRLSPDEKEKHKLSLLFVDSKGDEIIPPYIGGFNVSFKDDDKSIVNFIINMQRLKFDKYGNYFIKLIVDDKEFAEFPFYLKKTKSS